MRGRKKDYPLYAIRVQNRIKIIEDFLSSPLDEIPVDLDPDMTEQGTINAWNRTIRDRAYEYLCAVGYNIDGVLVLARPAIDVALCVTDYLKIQIKAYAELGVKKIELDISKASNIANAKAMASAAIRKLGLIDAYRAAAINGKLYLLKFADKEIVKELPYLDLRRSTGGCATLWIWDKITFGKDYTDECGHVYKVEDWCKGNTPHGIRVFTKAGRYLGWIPAEGRVPTWSGDTSSAELRA